jgi:membrane associated rhomboid family serine protease
MDQKQKNRVIGSFLIGLVMVMVLGLIFFIDREFTLNLNRFGVFPRELHGLKGIAFYPLLHGSAEHLFNNSVPLLVLVFCLFYFYPSVALRTFLLIYVLSGLFIWISARQNFHIGASGIVYGLAAFIFFSGIFRRDNKMIAISLMVAFLYGSMVWGIFPFQERVSWEGHLWGALTGVALAWLYRKEGPPRKLYQWQIDEIAEQKRVKHAQMMKAHPNVMRHPKIVIRRRQPAPDQTRPVQYIYIPESKPGR